MQDIAVLTYDTDTVLGLRFRLASSIEAIEIIGAADVTGSTVMVMTPSPETEVSYDLPGRQMLTDEELATERAIHGLTEENWISTRVHNLLVHQQKRSSSGQEISALVALAALQEKLQAPLVYLGESMTIAIDHERATILDKNVDKNVDENMRPEIAYGSYVCGATLTRAFLEKQGDTIKRLTFEAAGIQLATGVAEYLHGLDHLFALPMGGAIFSSLSASS